MSEGNGVSARGLLVLCEMTDGGFGSLTYELLGLGQRLAKDLGGPVCALVLGDPTTAASLGLIAAGADRVYAAPIRSPEVYASDLWLAAIRESLTKVSPRLILAGHTSLGADVAPRLAFRLSSAVATGCEQLTPHDGQLHATRPCFGHKAREVLSLRTAPAVATVRARSNEPLDPDTNRVGEVVSLPVPAVDEAAVPRVKSRQSESRSEGRRLETAQVVVAGGRGIGGPEGFSELGRLAEALGGVVGASRVACDLGWCPHSWQIGLTGKTVTPALYIAVGISGASHHMAGCGNSGVIVAINSDPEAAIFKEAQIGTVGDYRQIVPALVDEITKFKAIGASR